MPEGLFEMSWFSKVSSIFGRDAFATMPVSYTHLTLPTTPYV